MNTARKTKLNCGPHTYMPYFSVTNQHCSSKEKRFFMMYKTLVYQSKGIKHQWWWCFRKLIKNFNLICLCNKKVQTTPWHQYLCSIVFDIIKSHKFRLWSLLCLMGMAIELFIIMSIIDIIHIHTAERCLKKYKYD